ncbi:hypothetical protein SAMD00019534_107430, partial [Acytostelium subglobosum LB1]|uniref:hypothetical protein n=1 Tax=Acytostelium subglobosum LB1 TaxID=1410327 RepID=UPI000644F671
MGILSLLLDCVVISTAAAGVRRTVGYDLANTVLSKVQKPRTKAFVSGFFNVGEWVADKSTGFMRRQVASHKLEDYPLKQRAKPSFTVKDLEHPSDKTQ